jgi:hypothetical protein
MTVYHTDERLKGYLDSNQLSRERLALAVLALDRRFSDLKPRHPRGGPDGGRDIEAKFDGELVFGAVGFQNQATDADETRKKAMDKFKSDLDAALAADPAPKVFAFLTNVNLRQGEKDELVQEAQSKGITHAEVFDRERIRILLDTPEGFAARYQYLGLTLSEAEQAAFFARWGGDLQSLLVDGFGRLEGSLRRLQFLQESKAAVESFRIRLELDREYTGEELGHVRAFCHLFFKNTRAGLFQIRFGVTDNVSRLEAKTLDELDPKQSGAARGVIGPAWEQRFPRAFLAAAEAEMFGEPEQDDEADEEDAASAASPWEDPGNKWRSRGGYSSIGIKNDKVINLSFSQDSFIHLTPRFALEDLDDAMWILLLNKALAAKIVNIQVFADAYKLAEYRQGEFWVDGSPHDFKVGLVFTGQELSDPWVRIRPKRQSAFDFRFSEETPTRFYTPRETALSHAPVRLSLPEDL